MTKNDTSVGQNVFEFKSKGIIEDLTSMAEIGIQSWYKGVEDYNFIRGSNHGGIRGLMFSQIVWRSTERVGLAVALSKNKSRAVVVAFYDPPGNCSGEFYTNVYTAKVRNTGFPA